MTAGSLRPTTGEISLSSRGKKVKRWATCPLRDSGKSGDPVKWYHTSKEEEQGGRRGEKRTVKEVQRSNEPRCHLEMWFRRHGGKAVCRSVSVEYLSDSVFPSRCVLEMCQTGVLFVWRRRERRDDSQIRSAPFTSPSTATAVSHLLTCLLRKGYPAQGETETEGFNHCLIVCIAFYIVKTVHLLIQESLELSCPWNHFCPFLKAIHSTDALTIADVTLVAVAIASRSLCDFKESECLLLWALKKLEAWQLGFKPPARSCFRLCNCLLFCLKSFTPSSPLCSAVIIDGFELTTIPQHKLF